MYYGKNHFALISVKLVQHDLGSAQAANTAPNGGVTPVTYGVTPLDEGDAPLNHGEALLNNGPNQHDVDSNQVGDTPIGSGQDQPDALDNAALDTSNAASSGITDNHSGVVEDLKAAQTDVLAS